MESERCGHCGAVNPVGAVLCRTCQGLLSQGPAARHDYHVQSEGNRWTGLSAREVVAIWQRRRGTGVEPLVWRPGIPNWVAVSSLEELTALRDVVEPPPLPPGYEAAAGTNLFHIAGRTGRRGPFTIDEALGLIQSEPHPESVLVWSPGMSGWARAADVPAFSELLTAPTPPSTPPRPDAIPNLEAPPLPRPPQAQSSASLTTSPPSHAVIRLEGHASSLYAVEISPDGERIATGGRDGAVGLWDLRRRTLTSTLQGHEGAIMTVAFSHDGKLLASGGLDGRVCIWDLERSTLKARYEKHEGCVNAVAFSPDGRLLASASHDRSVRLWALDGRREVFTLLGHGAQVADLDFSSDGARLATASWDESTRLWDVKAGRVLTALEGHHGNITTVAFSPEGRRLLTASWDERILLWSLDTFSMLRVFEGHQHAIYDAAFSPDGRHIASASADRTLRLWDAHTGQLLHTFEGHTDWVRAVAFSPDGALIVSVSEDGTLRLWENFTVR